MYYCCGITDVGTVRDHNEDAFLINKIVMDKAMLESELHTPFITAVADGVGGEAGGEVASRLALNLLCALKPAENTDYEKKILDIHYALRKNGACGCAFHRRLSRPAHRASGRATDHVKAV